jgi:putative transposase
MDLDEHAQRFRSLILDRDRKFMSSFDMVLAAAGIQVLKTPPRAAKPNALRRTLGYEPCGLCLDWVLIWNRRHLERVLTDYVRHYNTAQPHRGIDP